MPRIGLVVDRVLGREPVGYKRRGGRPTRTRPAEKLLSKSPELGFGDFYVSLRLGHLCRVVDRHRLAQSQRPTEEALVVSDGLLETAIGAVELRQLGRAELVLRPRRQCAHGQILAPGGFGPVGGRPAAACHIAVPLGSAARARPAVSDAGGDQCAAGGARSGRCAAPHRAAAHRQLLRPAPTLWIALAAHPELSTRDLGSLRKAFSGASIMPVPVLQQLRKALAGIGFSNCLGQSEIGPLATVLRPEEHDLPPDSAGRPVLFGDLAGDPDEAAVRGICHQAADHTVSGLLRRPWRATAPRSALCCWHGPGPRSPSTARLATTPSTSTTSVPRGPRHA